MYVDLLTLYFIAIGTLLASAGMTFWEHRTNPTRSKALRILAAGFATLAMGCAAILLRRHMPVALASPISNLVILSGYLLILNGIAALSNRQYRTASTGLLLLMAVVWAVAGVRWQEVVWNYISSIPIALISAVTAWEMLRCDAMKPLKARYIVVAVAGIHALLYTGRAFLLPWLVSEYGLAIQSIASKLTVYEGALYSVILPMTLLKLVRDETHGQLLLESQTDYLTRLGNRRWFFEQGARIVEAGGAPVSVLAFDLDQFKAVNDQYGHQTGDSVLKSFAEVARSVLGPEAILARIGGEEFAALLEGESALHARSLGHAVRTRFAENVSRGTSSLGISATVSIGLAQYQNDVPPLADGLAAADRALYRAKSLGGNRLEQAQTAAERQTG
ncbi:GGDEF domain-containing protein [Achromobacter seleniivolatilans]|uniref:diguanylate cyclase n=1 Tax=Achromobacter seleniivolatilans TaxID=3047478 RepID=A0ABY9M9G9_9BURK|nr:GGDEF domain-containing protein [Achromobacter sp. R39]WMD23677.1 GGDEF domain-containing protein [Achromobacter sp. R39]